MNILTTAATADLAFFSPSKSKKPQSTPAVLVKTRFTTKSIPASPQPPSSPLSSPVSSPPQKKRPASAPSSALPRQVKRLRSSRASSRQRSPEPIYRIDRSRSASLFTAPEPDAPILNRRWAVDQDGTPGPRHLSSATVVTRLIKSYKPYFRNLDDPSDESFLPQYMPSVDLEYPNSHAVERFLLLAPKDKDHYNPIMDLERSLYTIIEFYLSPEQQILFGSLPDEALVDAASPPSSRSPSPSNRSISSLSSLSSRPQSPTSTLLRSVQRAIHRQDGPLFLRAMDQINALLRNIKHPVNGDSDLAHRDPTPTPSIDCPIIEPLPDNPSFDNTPNPLMRVVSSWTSLPLPKKVLMRLIEENYQRSVGPHVQKLKQYEAFSSTVYGELMPSLVYEIISLTQLKDHSLFMDLGSGVGNVVVQASLQTGCRSFGIELMPGPARVAKEMVEELSVRCKMWGIRMGEVELEEGNMLSSKRVDELLPQADVVLVDNKVFEESLNEALKPKFLDLKEGAIVISLSPFVPSLNARLTERNVDDISAIFEVTSRPYHSGSVSWGNNGGSYYIHRVDREGYARIREKFELSRSAAGNGSGRNTRSRRT